MIGSGEQGLKGIIGKMNVMVSVKLQNMLTPLFVQNAVIGFMVNVLQWAG